ncbi:hypothetical protein HU200_013948 [Digitaria exilis]|uniref:Uncharacterized protein n=1 Tax=Digitaria exilis TaxID=1010633 RepID=A0A835FCQ3_9POAL|nr:hypothetical protein HU200_013948 [Digitaria exilis]
MLPLERAAATDPQPPPEMSSRNRSAAATAVAPAPVCSPYAAAAAAAPGQGGLGVGERARRWTSERARDTAAEMGCRRRRRWNSLKLREEVDEERKMLQMAEVWREERVQMKLVDAKLMLDAKYTQLSKLQQEVESFVAASAVLIETSRYEPPAASEDIFSIFEELRPSEEPVIKEIEPCYKNSSVKCESEIQEASPMTDIFLEKKAKVYLNKSPQDESDTEDGSSWETISHEDMQGSSGSPDGSEPSVNNKICDGSISWKSRNEFRV